MALEATATPRATRHQAGVNRGDRAWNGLLLGLGLAVLVLAAVIIYILLHASQPLWTSTSPWQFLKSTDWDPVSGAFGALPFVYGTLVTSMLALLLAVPVGLGLSVFLTELAPKQLRPVVAFGVELLAGIPSVVYGLWGLFTLAPLLREHVEPFLQKVFGPIPVVGALFQGAPLGLGYLSAGVILAIMILPTICAVTTEVVKTVPLPLREASLALGATRWEMVRWSVLPYSKAGILGAVLLGLGRALGETMAVTMVIGNNPEIHASLFAPGYSLPSVIANEFAEATDASHTAALAALALVLFAITFLMNAAARGLVRRSKHTAGAHG
ncbi:MAG: phosphate ABC transporter permease subunit PstC [Deltaproteobacteria bacterium]|nr:phosphate ABC transporter permease subunit PstC [Deltaproteobacteria bacterium]